MSNISKEVLAVVKEFYGPEEDMATEGSYEMAEEIVMLRSEVDKTVYVPWCRRVGLQEDEIFGVYLTRRGAEDAFTRRGLLKIHLEKYGILEHKIGA